MEPLLDNAVVLVNRYQEYHNRYSFPFYVVDAQMHAWFSIKFNMNFVELISWKIILFTIFTIMPSQEGTREFPTTGIKSF